jgi:hypothetical protein
MVISAKNDKGATMIEMALVIGLFITMLIAIIDVGRVLISRSLLVAGAKDGLNLAIKAPNVALSLARCSTPPNGMTTSQCNTVFRTRNNRRNRLRNAMDAISQTALRIPLGTFFVDGRGVNPAPQGAFISALQILRPAEVDATNQIPSLVNNGHPIALCQDQLALQAPVDFVGYDKAFLRCPIGVRIIAQVNTLIPGIGPLTITGDAFGYREFGYSDSEVPEVRN